MEAVQRAWEAVEVGRGQIYEKARDWSSSGDLKMVSLMEHAFVARQTVFASSRRSRPAFGESGSGRPQLATEIGAVAALCNGQYWLIASCGARLDLLHVRPPHPPAWGASTAPNSRET
jgi:hypothetical protein